MSFKNHLIRFSALAALCAPALYAGNSYIGNKSWWAYTIIDFSDSTAEAGHVNWSKWVPPGQAAQAKYVSIELAQKIGGGGQCYNLTIENQGAQDNPDIRLWTSDNRSIDDDGPNNRQPRANLWITSTYHLRVSAFSSNHNKADFGIYNYMGTATSAAACDDGVTPFYNQSNNTILRANSLVN